MWVLCGIALGLALGLASVRHEELIFGSAGIAGTVGNIADEWGFDFMLAATGVRETPDWQAAQAVVTLLPHGLFDGLLCVFLAALLARVLLWAWLHATYEDPTIDPECPDARRARILASHGYSERCLARVQRERERYHARWGMGR